MKKIAILSCLLICISFVDVSAQRRNPERHRCERDDGRHNRDCLNQDRTGREKINLDSVNLKFGEFEQWNDNNGDSLKAESDSSKTFINKTDDLFGEFEELDESGFAGITSHETDHSTKIYWTAIALALTVLAGFLVRYPWARKFRIIMLISSLLFFGFYLGGCPCPISSLQNVVLAGMGADVHWQGLVWFLGLIPITYLFGKVWCGWICHLGGLQELIYRKRDKKLLSSEKAQKVLKWVRISLFVILIAQLFITQSNLYKEIDPFKAAFNLYPTNLVTWILVGLLIFSSLFIYRPFCRSVCPVGLALGWISKIPGASVFKRTDHCTACASCFKTCQINAITRGQYSKLNNEECIRCGECLDACRKKGLTFGRKKEKKDMAFEMKKVA